MGRSKLISKAASLPVGHPERKRVLARLRTAGASLETYLEPAIERFTSEALKIIRGYLASAGSHITDIRVDAPVGVDFKTRGVQGRINVFVDFSGGKAMVEIQYRGKKDWVKRVPLNVTRDVKDFASTVYYTIPSKLLS